MQIVPLLLDCLPVLIKDAGNKEIIYNILLVMSGILLEKNGKTLCQSIFKILIQHSWD